MVIGRKIKSSWESFLNADFWRQKLRETFGVVICVSQYACSLKSKMQKNSSGVNLATKGIQLASL